MFANEPLKNYKIPCIEYNSEGVIKEGKLYPSSQPRLLFAQMLAEIEQEILIVDRWREWDSWINIFEGSYIHKRVEFNREKVKVGFGTTIGAAGFGYERDENNIPFLIPHLGGVRIENGVSVGNCCTIDRSVLGQTVIGENTKLDNHIHVGHGAQIGKNVLIVAGAVLGGSCEVGDNTFIGGNVFIKNKVKVGKNCTIGAGAIVIRDVEDGQTIIGNPGKPLIKSVA